MWPSTVLMVCTAWGQPWPSTFLPDPRAWARRSSVTLALVLAVGFVLFCSLSRTKAPSVSLLSKPVLYTHASTNKPSQKLQQHWAQQDHESPPPHALGGKRDAPGRV